MGQARRAIAKSRELRDLAFAPPDWTGTSDPTPWLALPDTLLALARLHSAGIAGLMAENRAKAVLGRRRLLNALGIDAPCPASWLGAMATVALPDTVAAHAIAPQ